MMYAFTMSEPLKEKVLVIRDYAKMRHAQIRAEYLEKARLKRYGFLWRLDGKKLSDARLMSGLSSFHPVRWSDYKVQQWQEAVNDLMFDESKLVQVKASTLAVIETMHHYILSGAAEQNKLDEILLGL